MLAGRAQCQLVTQGTKPCDYTDGHVGNVGVAPEFLPRVHVAQMNFDKGNGHREQGVPQRDAGMGQSPGIQQDEVGMPGGLLDPVHQGGFGIGLKGLQLVPRRCGGGGD